MAATRGHIFPDCGRWNQKAKIGKCLSLLLFRQQ
jgi:hypothetical protein